MSLPGADGLPDARRVANVLGGVVLVVLVGAVVVAAIPGLIGMSESYVVRSDSMSPSIGAGSVVFVSSVPASEVGVGDVITFQRASADSRVTHRVVDVSSTDGERVFTTKGDANEEADPAPVRADQVIGRVAFSVPFLGYVLSFARSPLGIVAFLVVPGVLLAASEFWRLYSAPATAEDGGEGS